MSDVLLSEDGKPSATISQMRNMQTDAVQKFFGDPDLEPPVSPVVEKLQPYLDALGGATPEPSPPRFKLKPHKPKSSRSYEKKELRSSSSNKESCQKPRWHNSEVLLSTITEETHFQDSTSSMSSLDQQQDPSSVHSRAPVPSSSRTLLSRRPQCLL